ncbi:MAG: hypothetical protein AAF840_13665, partial [Bacteroidota bacterium]
KAYHYLVKLKERYPSLTFSNMFYDCDQPTEKAFRAYLETIVFKRDHTPWFQQVGSPVFVFSEAPYKFDKGQEYRRVSNKSGLSFLLTNPILKDFEFYRIVDSYSCYQSLAQFLSGVLTDREKIKNNLTDLQKIRKHGFDAKYGFRKRPDK